ncbi:LiaF transmembrane domain-containing protein [Neobacillus niacini]|uniref:LiaF transmembrane domain-containing protein n=1 Tax=Neobacillus niacini TaxID=86668 RepID=UPI0039837DDA
MRTWRVGTFSMGASLVFLGLFLFLSRFMGLDLVHVMSSWWPILLIVLGIEILLYLFFSKQEKPILKYDFVSILFVGLLGTIGILFATLSATGVMGKVEELAAREERSFELPNFTYQIDDSIKRVVLRTASYQTTVEATDEKELSMFGTYRTETAKREKLIKSSDEYVYANKKGDTLFVNVKTLPNEVGPFYSRPQVASTILIPKGVELEVISTGASLSLNPRGLENNWSIDGASELDVKARENSNLNIEAVNVYGVEGAEGAWNITKKGDPNQGDRVDAVHQSGEGKYQVTITNTNYVSLNRN